ncbi:RICIN domain-containing protein [Actinoplanes teichomyceticus]|uniref:Ricin-type beta-trefoil lectin protein n=1 Tax=Actinoplanes teichomyceticus TaxID=1867 RepID=A0A561VLT1_ACTTI|nr:RICIN domain-containing protein [Actinoplanes teichomyceticus]TWG12575.1 ricin-type beta-trefoil lectin protein [Actinoplanes teichomyceticus]GIF13942.1 hypothetical protein Ate01nite_39740 [Actinoplanes teichomyceticus]
MACAGIGRALSAISLVVLSPAGAAGAAPLTPHDLVAEKLEDPAARPVGRGYIYHEYVARHSQKCLDVKYGGRSDGADVIQWRCHGGDNQSWRFAITDWPDFWGTTYVNLINERSGKCLDVKYGSKTDGADVIQWRCHDGDNQKWTPILIAQAGGRNYFLIKNKGSGKCLDVKGSDVGDGADVIQWRCRSSKNQEWEEITSKGVGAAAMKHATVIPPGIRGADPVVAAVFSDPRSTATTRPS